MQNHLICRILSSALLCAAILPACAVAGDAKAYMPVSATVLAYSKVSLLHTPDALVITGDDVRRGFVDVDDATALSIRSNNPRGHLLTLAAESPMLASMQVRSRIATSTFGARGGSLAVPLSAEARPLEFSVRFVLSEQARPGVYAWPLSVMVDPL
jgi:hypothetical protein